MTEKKFTYILVSVAVAAILFVILLNIPWGGERAKLAKEFELEKNHILVTISFDDVIKKINGAEEFQLFVGTTDDKVFVHNANELAKEHGVEKIYYLNYRLLNEEQVDTLKANSSSYIKFPSMLFFEVYDEEFSSALYISGIKDINDFDGNIRDLLSQYFIDCYGE